MITMQKKKNLSRREMRKDDGNDKGGGGYKIKVCIYIKKGYSYIKTCEGYLKRR